MDTRGIFAELKQRRVYRVVAVYVVAVFGLWQAADIAIPALSLPQALMRYIVGGALLGFPLVVILSWLYDLRIRRAEPRVTREPVRIVRAAIFAVLGAAVIFLAGRLIYRTFERETGVDPALSPVQISFELGVERYFAGDRADAAAILEAVASDTTLGKDRRQEALRYLVRIWSEADDTVQARGAMRRLLSLEPPLALMLPVVETDRVMELYYEARREKLARQPAIAASPVVSSVEILDFVVLGEEPEGISPEEWQPLGRGVKDILLTDLNLQLKDGVVFVERSIAGRSYDVYRYLESAEAGRITRPTHLLIGSLASRRGQVLLSAWLIDAGLGTLTHSHQVLGALEELNELTTALSGELARAILAG